MLGWINDEIEALGEEQFFHADYDATLVDTYGEDYKDELVVEGGVTGAAEVETEAVEAETEAAEAESETAE